MSFAFRYDRVFGDRPFAEAGDPVLVVDDERLRMLAVAGAYDRFGDTSPVGVYNTDDLMCRAFLRTRFPVHAMAFHPTLALLAIGSGCYDRGYSFEGELLLLDLETGTTTSLFEEYHGREVLGLRWLDHHRLRVQMSPSDDYKDKSAWVEGNVTVLDRPDWRAVPPNSITWQELNWQRIPMPRPDDRAQARQRIDELAPKWAPRHNIRAIEQLSDGRVIAALDGVALESWSPAGQLQWTVPDNRGGRDIVIAGDEQTAWTALDRPPWLDEPPSVARIRLRDGERLDALSTSGAASLVQCADGAPALVPDSSNRGRLRIRGGTRAYLYDIEPNEDALCMDEFDIWLATAPLDVPPADGSPREPAPADFTRVFPFSWVPGEAHFAGPGVETAAGDLVYASTVYHGHGLQPGGSFVVHRDMTTGEPTWVFRTDRKPTCLDADAEFVYIGYEDGELVALDLDSGTVLAREHLTIAMTPVIPTAVTVTATGRILIGTDDGRILLCSNR